MGGQMAMPMQGQMPGQMPAQMQAQAPNGYPMMFAAQPSEGTARARARGIQAAQNPPREESWVREREFRIVVIA